MSDSDLWARITTLQMKLAAAEKQSAARREAMAELERERDAARKLVIRDGADQVVTQGAFNALVGQRDDLQAKLDDIEGAYRIVIDEKCASDEKHCTCVPHLRRRIDELALHRNKLNKALNAACASGTSHRERADALEAELREWKRGEHTHSQTRSARFIGQGNHDAGHP